MLNFRKITLADRPWIQEALKQSDFMGCEYSFANNLAWCRAADSQICQYENFYLTCSFDTEDGAPHFSYPCGSGDLRKAILAMADFAAVVSGAGLPLELPGIVGTKEVAIAPIVSSARAAKLILRRWAKGFDRTADFVALAGKRYHKKRNHIAQFSKYGAVFSEITPNDFDECITFAAESYNAKGGYSDASSVAEQYAIHTFFQNFEALELKGGLLRVDGELAAFSIGEPICSNTFGVHIEKADTRFHGAYPAMAQAFAAHFAMDYTYLNREEDLGIPGLRKSKLSYYPELLLEKWTATCDTPEKLL